MPAASPPVLLFGRIIPPSPPPQDLGLSPRAVADLASLPLSHNASDDDDEPSVAAYHTEKLSSSSSVDAGNFLFTTSLPPQAMAARDSPHQNDADKALQKPDKPVSFPRCDSLKTKFCYFNNYNIKQPRHFCKSCQRYWTAGGTLRNVPIGAGRRKNKNCANSGKPHSEIVTPRSDHPDAAQRLHFAHNPNHANFVGPPSDPGLHIPVVDMIESSPVTSSFPSLRQQQFYSSSGYLPSGTPISTAIERSAQETVRGSSDCEKASRGAKVPGADMLTLDEKWLVSPISAVENENSTLCSSVTALSSTSEGVSVSNLEGGTPALSNMAGEEGFANLTATGWGGADLPLAFPFSYMTWPGDAADGFFPWPPVFTALWTPLGCGVPSNFGWNASAAAAPGKRQRSPAEQQGSLCVPKTLRIDHPEEAAQSSILATLGFGSVPAQSPPSTGFCNAFQPKAEVFQPKAGVRVSNQLVETQHLHTNPAAQARSIAFQEGR